MPASGKPFEKGNKIAKGGARPGAGRPPDEVRKAAKEIAQGFVPAALEVIRHALESPEVEPQHRLKAAELMLAYAWHKPTQPTQHMGDMGWTKNYEPETPTEAV